MSFSLYPTSSDSAGPALASAPPPVTYPLRPVVLVIDDEPGVRDSLRFILKEDFEVLEAADGAAGLDIIRSRRVDVALLDVRMPGESGPAVLPRILALSESIAVILITNRLDFVDEAIVDRFLSYEFALSPVAVLEEVTREKAKLQRLTEEDLQPVLNAIRAPGAVKSIREIERMVMRAYVDKLLKAPRSDSL